MEYHNNYVRSALIFFLFFALYAVIIVNLYVIQIKQASFFKDLAEKQYNVTIQSYPERGNILDRHNRPVAINKDTIACFILPKELVNKTQTLAFLKKYFPQAYERFGASEQKNFMFVKRNLTPEEIKIIEQANSADLQFLNESSRFYPYQSLGTLIGITDIDNNGLFGIEQICNSCLQGTPTTYHLQKDAKQKHFYFAQKTMQEGTVPQSIQLSLDADLQFKHQQIVDDAAQKAGAIEAAALSMDPETGEIFTMVSYPHFNPNDIKDLDLDTTKNRPITECFEAGSVIKVFAAIAALEEEIVAIDTIIDCENTKETKIDHLRVRTVTAQGAIPFIDVIKQSNNIGVVKVTKQLGSDLYNYYTMLGFGQPTGIGLPGEQKGFVNHPSNWSLYSIQSLSYGYEITTNLLQLARAFSTLINGGFLITPTVFKDKKVEKIGPIISQKTIQDMQQILQETVLQGSGKKAHIEGYKVLGKTGTANLLINGQYDDDRHLYTFIGSVEQDQYKRVIVAYIKDSKHASYASLIAAPLFKELAQATLLHDHIFVQTPTNNAA